MEELNVKVGDKVIIQRSRYDTEDFIAEIKDITPTGIIKLSIPHNIRFNKYGKQMGSTGYYPYTLAIPTEEDYKRIEKNQLVRKIQYTIRSLNTASLFDLDITTLTIIKAALDCIGVEDEKAKEEKLKQILDTLAARNDNCKTKNEETALEATIKTIIKMSRYYGASDNETAVNLIKELNITKEEAEKLIYNYDKEMDEALENTIRTKI